MNILSRPYVGGVDRPAAGKPVGQPVGKPVGQSAGQAAVASSEGDFARQLQQVMRTQSRGVAISAHAGARLHARGITVTPHMMEQLAHGADRLAQKNARESLVVVGNVGFVMNVPNRTVVTALPLAGADGHVFTNIDSALWLGDM